MVLLSTRNQQFMSKVQCIAIFMVFSLCVTAQAPNQKVIDSLEKVAGSQKDTLLIKTYNELTWQYRAVSRDKAIEYGNKAIALGQQLQFLPGIAQAYNDLGIIFFDKENYDTAIALYGKSMEMRRSMGDELGMGKLYNKIGIIYQKQGLFEKAEENQFKALELFEKTKYDLGTSYALTNIGILNQNLGRFEEAIQYQQRAIAMKEKSGDKMGLAASYINVGNCYLNFGQLDKAQPYYKKAEVIARELKDKEYISNALNNQGTYYIRTAQYDKAIPVIRESYTLRDSLKDTKGMVSCLANLGDVYVSQKKYDSAAIFLDKALEMGEKAVNCKPEINKLYSIYSRLYEEKGEPQKALEMMKLYSSTKDSLYTDQLGEKFALLETKYKTLEKEKKIQAQQFQITKRNYWIAGAVGALLLLALLAYSRYKRYKLKKEKELQDTIMQQQEAATRAVIEAEEKERSRIAGDLHDGVGQMMSAAKMNLSAFEDRIVFKTEADKTSYEKLIILVDDSCKEVRSVSHNMMPNALIKAGLDSAVREFVDKIDSKVIKVNLYTEGVGERLNSNVETVLYRVIQECVNNVIKHAQATQLDISLVKDADGIAATIEDNGRGFDTEQKQRFEGIGLQNIKTRIAYLKGTVDFDSAPGRGTLVAIHVPV
jgi:two-component system, NarL family, sensor kinase